MDKYGDNPNTNIKKLNNGEYRVMRPYNTIALPKRMEGRAKTLEEAIKLRNHWRSLEAEEWKRRLKGIIPDYALEKIK